MSEVAKIEETRTKIGPESPEGTDNLDVTRRGKAELEKNPDIFSRASREIGDALVQNTQSALSPDDSNKHLLSNLYTRAHEWYTKELERISTSGNSSEVKVREITQALYQLEQDLKQAPQQVEWMKASTQEQITRRLSQQEQSIADVRQAQLLQDILRRIQEAKEKQRAAQIEAIHSLSQTYAEQDKKVAQIELPRRLSEVV